MPDRAHQPAAIAQSFGAVVLRFDGAGPGAAGDAPAHPRWLAGLEAAVALLASLPEGECGWGRAFDRAWPYWRAGDGRVVAPAVPGVVGATEVELQDGAYRQDEGGIIRAACGPPRRLLAFEPAPQALASEPGLVWFDANQRYLAAAGRLQIEDVFAQWTLPWTVDVRDRLLLVPRRLPAAIVDGIALTDGDAHTEVEVARDLRLVRSARWRDPAAMLATRFEVDAATHSGDRLHLQLAGNRRSELIIDATENGWTATRKAGGWPYDGLSLTARNGFLLCRASVGAGFDPTVAAARAAVTFDLVGGLVALADD